MRAENAHVLYAGFGKASITPDYSVPLAAYGNSAARMSQKVLHPLFATCIALEDGSGQPLLLITTDVNNVYDAVLAPLREEVTAATGVSPERVIVSATHTHSGPDQMCKHPAIEQYRPFFRKQVVQACQQALADLAPATLRIGSVDVENMTFVRHYRMNDGTYSGANFGSTESGYAGHEREADKQLQLVRFCREGKADILLVNWQAHALVASTRFTPESFKNRPHMSSDYVGVMRDYVTEQTGLLVAFYLGSAGNQNPHSNIPEIQKNVPTDVNIYGRQLGDWVIDCAKKLAPARSGPIRLKKTMFAAQRDHSEDCNLEQALTIKKLWNETNDRDLCYAACKGTPILSPYHATSVVSRAQMPTTPKEMELNAIGFGDVGIATVPYEMFCQNAKAVKAGSPFDITIMITCCCGANNYVAADAAFEYGSYEVQNRTFVRGTAEAAQDTLIAMLKELG